jgi:SpoVK/Ycf46/Vps4 family AAA+-type ATPase
MKVIAADTRFTVFNVSAASLLSKWHGESQKMVRILYKTAWEHNPSIIFIDEFDSLFGSSGRSGSESSHTANQIQSELLHFLDGIETPSINETVTIVATNRPRKFTTALLRRFDKILYVAPPNKLTVHDIFSDFLKSVDHTLTRNQFDYLLHELCAYTPAEMKQIFTVAYYRSFRKYTAASSSFDDKVFPNKIVFFDFRVALKNVKPVLRLGRNIGQTLINNRSWNEVHGKPEILYRKHFYESDDYYYDNPVRLTSID